MSVFDGVPPAGGEGERPAAPTRAPASARRLHPILRLLAFFLLLAAAGMAAGAAWRLFGLPRPVRGDQVLPFPMLGVSAALLFAGVAGTWVTMRLFERRGLATLGFAGAPGTARRIAFGFIGGGLTPASVAVGLAVAGHATIAPGAPSLAATLPVVLGLIAVSSWEEVFLRGYAMQLLAEAGGPWLAVIVSGAVFGAIHAGNPGANPAGLVITGVNGVLLALLVVRSGSLWMACAYHSAWNLVAAIGFGLRDSGIVHPGALAVTGLAGPAWLTGGAYGFEASYVTGIVEAGVLLAMLALVARVGPDAVARPFYEGSRTASTPATATE